MTGVTAAPYGLQAPSLPVCRGTSHLRHAHSGLAGRWLTAGVQSQPQPQLLQLGQPASQRTPSSCGCLVLCKRVDMCKYDAYIQPSGTVASCRRGAGFRTPDGGSVPRAAGSPPATTVVAKAKKQAWLPQCPSRRTTRAAQGRAEMEPLLRVLKGVISAPCHSHSCRRATATCMALRSLWRLWPCWSCLTGFLLPHSPSQLGLSAHSRPPGLLACQKPDQSSSSAGPPGRGT